MDKVCKVDKKKRWGEASIVITDDSGIRIINQKYLASSEITDVISFCYDPMPCDKGAYSAEIIVNVQQAVREGARHGRCWNPSLELALYLAHGCDHLTGENDYHEAGRTRMRRRELRWLKEARMSGLTDKLI